MNIAFILSMPGRASWNGGWSGEGSCYAIVKTVGRSAKAQQQAEKIAAQRFYSYGWSDGWRASVEVKLITSDEARKLRKKSRGFCGYDWMVDSIYKRGCILSDFDMENCTAP